MSFLKACLPRVLVERNHFKMASEDSMLCHSYLREFENLSKSRLLNSTCVIWLCTEHLKFWVFSKNDIFSLFSLTSRKKVARAKNFSSCRILQMSGHTAKKISSPLKAQGLKIRAHSGSIFTFSPKIQRF